MFASPAGKLREELLALEGIGPETADSILLYAGQMPVFVVDAYTRRVFEIGRAHV
jgi:endonuclease-3 related protein